MPDIMPPETTTTAPAAEATESATEAAKRERNNGRLVVAEKVDHPLHIGADCYVIRSGNIEFDSSDDAAKFAGEYFKKSGATEMQLTRLRIQRTSRFSAKQVMRYDQEEID